MVSYPLQDPFGSIWSSSLVSNEVKSLSRVVRYRNLWTARQSFIYLRRITLSPDKQLGSNGGDAMKKRITIGAKDPNPVYMPKDLVNDGFVGTTWMLANAKTATIIKPGASLEDIKTSLEIVLMDINLRLRDQKPLIDDDQKEENPKEMVTNGQ